MSRAARSRGAALFARCVLWVLLVPLFMLFMASTFACSGVSRSRGAYLDDTAVLLDTREPQVQGCYDQALQRNRALVGKLTLTVRVERGTGKLIAFDWDRNRSTVDELLAVCVMRALEGLRLEDPDRREAEVPYSWVFRPLP